MDYYRQLFIGSIILLVTTGTAVVWGEAIGLALFIDHWGVEALPLAIIVEAITSIILITYIDQVRQNIPDGILVVLICALGIGLILIGIILVELDYNFGYAVYYIAQRVIRDLLVYHTTRYIFRFFEQQNRYLIPRMLLWSRIWIVFSGLSLTLLTLVFSIQEMVWLWIGSLIVSVVVVAFFADEFRPSTTAYIDHERHVGTFKNSLSGVMRYLWQTPLVRYISITSFCMMFLMTILYFEIVEQYWFAFSDEILLLRWLGLISSAANLLALPVQYNLLPKLLGKTTVTPANYVFPTAVGFSVVGLFSAPNLFTALGSDFVRATLQRSLYDPIHNQVQHVLPQNLRYWIHAVTEGMVEPLGRLVAGMALVFLVINQISLWGIFMIGGVLVIIFMLTQLQISRIYSASLAEQIEQGQYGFLRSIEEQLAPNRNIVDELLDRLRENPSTERDILLLAEALAESHTSEGFTELLAMYPRCSDDIKAELLLLLAEGWPQHRTGEAIRAVVVDALESEDIKLRLSALRAMTLYPHLLDPFRVAQFLLDRDPETSTLAAQLLLKHGSPKLAKGAQAQLNWLSNSSHSPTRALALNALVEGGINRFGERVIPISITRFQNDQSARVRLNVVAAASYEDLVAYSVKDPSPTVRHAAIRRLLQKRRFSRGLLERALEDYTDCYRPDNFQTKRVFEFWYLQIAQVTMLRRPNTPDQNDLIGLGVRQIDYLATLYKTFKNVSFASTTPVVVELEQNRNHLLGLLLDYLGQAFGVERVRAISRTLQRRPTEQDYKIAQALLSELVTPHIASQFEKLLQQAPHNIDAVTKDSRWHVYDNKSVVKMLLSQEDNWLALFNLFALSYLPVYQYAPLVDPKQQNHILELSRHSQDDDIREGARLLRRVFRQHENETADGTLTPIVPNNFSQGMNMLSTIERMLFLRNVTFFENLRLDQLRTLARICQEMDVNPGEYILHQGEAGDSLFIIVEGQVNIIDKETNGEETLIAIRKPGDVIGEISLFDGGLRSADAIARNHTLVLVIYRETLDNALADDPGIALDMLRAMAQLVRTNNQSIAEMSAQLNVKDLTENA